MLCRTMYLVLRLGGTQVTMNNHTSPLRFNKKFIINKKNIKLIYIEQPLKDNEFHLFIVFNNRFGQKKSPFHSFIVYGHSGQFLPSTGSYSCTWYKEVVQIREYLSSKWAAGSYCGSTCTVNCTVPGTSTAL